MAYADGIRSGNPTMDDVGDLIEGLLVDQAALDTASAITSSTSSTYVAISDMDSTVTVASGDYVFITYGLSYSYDGTSVRTGFTLYEDGSAVDTGVTLTSWAASTNGYTDVVSSALLLTSPATGSVTYDLRWRIVSGSGTMYATHRNFVVIPFRAS